MIPIRKEARMRAVGLLPALLLGFVPVPLVFGTEPGVTLTVCNAGKVDVDAYLVRPGSTLTSHIAPAKCGVLEKVEGTAKPGTIGFGFTDIKGQWGGVRRTDGLPESGNGVFAPVKQTLTVKHGSANVDVAGLLSYTSAAPYCAQTQSPAPVRAPATTTAGRIADAVRGAPLNDGPVVCHDQTYSLTVIPYADSHELAFDSHCYPCESPEERAALENATATDMFGFIANAPGRGGPIGQGILNMTQSALNQDQAERSRRNEIAKGPYLMNWKDLASFITSAFGGSGRPPLMANRYIVLRGTVARLQLPNPGAQFPWVHVFFKEASTMEPPVEGLPGDYFIRRYLGKEDAFGICATDPGIFSEIFGANYGTAMVGQSVEMEGEINVGACAQAVGIHVTLTRQVKIVTPGMPTAKGQTWVPKLGQPQQPAQPAVTAAPAPNAPAVVNREEVNRAATARAEALRRNAAPAPQAARNPAASPAPATTASVAPAQVPVTPAPAAPAAQVRDPLINNVISLLKAKLPEIQIMLMLKQRNRSVKLSGADRAELEDAGASEKLIDAVMNPASIGPEVTPQAAAAAARQNAASPRERR